MKEQLKKNLRAQYARRLRRGNLETDEPVEVQLEKCYNTIEKIDRLVKKQGRKKAWITRTLGLDQSTIYMWMNGTRYFSLANRKKVLDLLE